MTKVANYLENGVEKNVNRQKSFEV